MSLAAPFGGVGGSMLPRLQTKIINIILPCIFYIFTIYIYVLRRLRRLFDGVGVDVLPRRGPLAAARHPPLRV